MPRIKKVPTLSHAKATVMKKLASAASKAKALALKPGQDGLVHTGKLKVPFRPATAASVAKAKKGLIKQLKRRWKSGTVAKREIRKLTRTTHLLFPKRPFQRLVREITQDFKSDVRFTDASLQAIQEAAEIFVTEMFHKSDMARKHTRRNTLHVEDIRFSRFMTQESLWVPPERIWDKETFMAIKGSAPKQPSKKKAKAEPKKPEAQAPAQPAAAPGPDQAATPEEGVQPKGGSKKGKRPADSDSEEDEDVGGSASDEGEEDDRGQ